MWFSPRLVALTLLALAVVALIARVLPDDQAAAAAIRLGLSTAAVGVVPGALLMLVVWPRGSIRLLELLGVGITLSFALVGLLTAGAIVLHGSVNLALIILFATSLALSVIAAVQDDPRRRVWVGPAEITLGISLLAVGAVLYVDGQAPFAGEDQIHISVIRRLAALPYISLDNFYIAPGVIYTYPIPGTHFFFALVSNLSTIDPLFVYQKLRFLWAVSSILTLYLAARLLLSSDIAAVIAVLTGTLFAVTGSFATVEGYFWGQLFPYSHASDVAMNVLLPALLVLTLYLLHTRGIRRALALLVLTALSVVLVTLAHSREIVQLVVYLGSFSLAVFALRLRGKWPYALRACALLALTVSVVGVYSAWQRSAAGSVDLLEATRKAGMQNLMAALSPFSNGTLRIPWDLWLHAPLSADNENPGALGYGWNAIGLVLGPVLLLVLRRNAGLILVAASVVAYLLIIRLLVLSATFQNFTYSEVLSTPVRNVIYFVYIGIGAGVYLAAVNLGRLRSRVLGVGVAVGLAVVLGVGVYPRADAFVRVHADAVFFGVPLLYAIAFAAYRSRRVLGWAKRVLPRREPTGWILPYLALVVPLAVFSSVPSSVPLGLTQVNAVNPAQIERAVQAKWQVTPASMLDQVPCCAPTSVFVSWAREGLPLDAVVAWNALNPYLLTTFLPQQMPAPTGNAGPAVFLEYVTPTYYAIAERAKQEGHSQPFFDPAESPSGRLDYLRALHVTHVVLDPATYETMRRVLLEDPALFEPLYDDGRWAAFRVHS